MGFLDKFLGPPGQDKFARMVIDAIRQAGETEPVHYDRDKFQLRHEGEHKGLMNLGNAYKEYLETPADRRPSLFKNLVPSWFTHRRETPEEFEDVKPDLLPTVRARAYYEITSMRMKTEEGPKVDWPYRPLAESLGVGLVYDLPESMMQVQRHNLDRWGVTFDDALETAGENLQQITRHEMLAVAPGVWRSPWRDNYDPSRLLLGGFIRHHKVAGDPVAMVPNRDTLLLAGAGDPAGLAKLVELAAEAFEHARSISGLAYRVDEAGEWVPYLPPPNHPQFTRFNQLRLKYLASDYGDQAAALKALHEKTGKDIFVPKFTVVQKKETRELRSYCVWAANISSFLPKTDDIYFYRPTQGADSEMVGGATWDQVAAVVGDLLKPMDIYPERFLVDGFPTPEQFAALGLK
ncbi:MAG: hypothetical protein ACJ8F7_20760 [Gemmataceae bacterium]